MLKPGKYSAFALLPLLNGCATQPASDGVDVPGIFSGFWHGLIAPLALVAEIFTDVRIYSFPNSGGGYDFGFMVGILISIFFILLSIESAS